MEARKRELSRKSFVHPSKYRSKKTAGHPEYSHQVGIAVPLNKPNEHGFPQNEEFDQLNEIEDLISKRLEVDNESLLVGILTTDGMRGFVLYTSDPAAIKTKFEELSGLIQSHELQLMIQLDKAWSVYKWF